MDSFIHVDLHYNGWDLLTLSKRSCAFKADIAAFLFCHIYNEFLDNASASVSKLFSFRFDLWFHFK